MLIKTDLAGRGVTVAPRASGANTHVAVAQVIPFHRVPHLVQCQRQSDAS